MAGTSTINPADYLTSTTTTYLSKPPQLSMDPGTALAISAGSSALSGGLSAGGSKKGASKASEAAKAQSEAVKQAAREAPLIGFGLEAAGKEYDYQLGGPMDRLKAVQDSKLATASAFSPGALAKERLRLSRELAGVRQAAYGKEMDPYRMFG